MPVIAIQWAARSRATSLPASALSAVITIQGAGVNGGDIVLTADRDMSNSSAFTQTVTGTVPVREGTYPMSVNAYAAPDGALPVVAVGSATATIGDSGALPDATLVGSISTVDVTAGSSVVVGGSTNLVVTAYDATHAVVLVSPGSIFLNLAGSSLISNVGGGTTIQGLYPGNADVTATIDGVTSTSTAVTVTSNTVVTISSNAPPSLLYGQTATFTATVTGAPLTTVTWSVAGGASNGTITSDGVYTAPNNFGVYYVVATSQYDPTRFATYRVNVVVAPPPVAP